MILLIRSDEPQAELYLLDIQKVFAKDKWLAERRLANELLPHIEALLKDSGTKLADLDGIGVFTGSGSFTGLRIGATVANTLAYSLGIPIVVGQGSGWQKQAVEKLTNGGAEHIIVPSYERPANITQPKSQQV
ncbi:tRNA (adenosine(37)-N6)-threonylcarbamoyltransferase complex dimerization subunit type 1 TsaB [Candidatus Saccharibacteria bacterium]|nr:tRNA (adenosine(37)-N6)-threonylcarbamoyltransferase complex dimerization subunit type 1 TsaB [Candidatus Saccharibacteria bacterium]